MKLNLFKIRFKPAIVFQYSVFNKDNNIEYF